MPNYEYACESCGGRFEVIRKFSDPLLTECQLCHAKNVRKVLSPTAFVLKGSGWYATDYASKDRKDGLSSDKPKEDPKPAAAAGCGAGTCAGGCPAAKG